MRTTYPLVRSEEDTFRRVLAGASVARFGDGEFKHCADKCNVSQAYDPRLSARLREILLDAGSCMVGIPNLNPDALERMTEQKRTTWPTYRWAAQYLCPTRAYASAFITRPDSAPWIDTPDYWAQIESVWAGREVTLVRGSEKSLNPEDLASARHVRDIVAPRQHAYAEYAQILERVGRPERAIICLGPTATVLAVDLCARGVHAIDLGHIALFLRKHRRGDPMGLSKDDKSQDKVRV